MRYIAYERETHVILALAPSPWSALKAAREVTSEDVDTRLASDALASALTKVGATTPDWYLDGRGIARLPEELGLEVVPA
jgi:hypothetical protein